MTTETFRITPATYARHQMRIWTRDHWWLVAIPPAISLILAVAVDWKFLFVAVILVFLVIPHIMVTVYYYHALSPRSAMSILPHHLAFEADSIRIIYDPVDAHDEADTEVKRADDIIRYADITGATRHKSDVILHLASGKYDILVIPGQALPDGAIPDRIIS